MKRRLSGVAPRTLAFYVGLVLAAAAVITFGLEAVYHKSSSASTASETATVSRGTVLAEVTADGNISAVTTEDVNFATSGTVSAVDVAVGDKVHQGEVIGKLDPSTLEQTLTSAKDQLAVARANLTSATAGPTTATKDAEVLSLEQAHLSVTEDKATVKTDENDVAKAKTQLHDYIRLGCPYISGLSAVTASGASSTGSSSSSTSGGGSSSTTTSSSSNSAGSEAAQDSTGSGSGSSGSSSQSTVDSTTSSTTVTSTSVPTTTTTTTTTTTIPETAPTATTGSASAEDTTVTFAGSVDPDEAATTYFFQYGTTTGYGKQTASTTLDSGDNTVSVSATAAYLAPTTTYLYRLVAHNSDGTTYGASSTFTTSDSSCAVERSTLAAYDTDLVSAKRSESSAALSLAETEASDSTSSSNVATIAQDQETVDQDAQNVTTDEKYVGETTLTAPVAGTVTAVSDAVGSSVSAGTDSNGSSSSTGSSSSSSGVGSSSSSSSSASSSGFVTISSVGDYDVVVGFAEADATKIAAGEAATATLPAITDSDIEGKVVAVSPTATVVSDVVTYDVTIDLEDPPAEVKDGMTADVNVITSAASNVLLVPSAAITTTGTISTVSLLEHGSDVTTRVTTGLVGTSDTQILTGLKVGDVIVLPTVSVSTTTGSSTTGSGFGGGGFGGGGGGFSGGGGGFSR